MIGPKLPQLPDKQTADFRWLYIDFNSYFASVEQQLHPQLRGKPVAVVPVDTDATCAIAASYEAKAYGIKTGTPIWEAKQKCPGLICVLAQHEHYIEFHHRILDEIDRHVPVTEVCSIDEAAVRLMDNETDPARATEIALSIKKGLAQNIGEAVKCSIGIAPNKYLAKVATDLHKPDGLTFLAPSDLPNKLLTMKLRDFPGIGYNMEKRLLLAGIGDVQDLWGLNPKRMRAIWGNLWGEKMYYMLRGVELPEEETSRSSIGHSHVMAPELREPLKAKYVARRLTLKAASRLRRMGYYAAHFHLSMRIENGLRWEGSASCYRAQDSMTFLDMLDEAWNGIVKEAGRGVRIKKVSVTLSGLIAADALQPELFNELPDKDLKKRHKAEKMSAALDKINHRFGRDSVLVGMLPSQGRSFSGTKIAFTRIPDLEEFLE
jgi:DNA polymerase-4